MTQLNLFKSDGIISPRRGNLFSLSLGERAGVRAIIILTLFASILTASAQSNNGVPGSADYDKFSKFITDRNIFDPNRQPHIYNSNHVWRPTTRHRTGTPSIQLVGTMNYEKGMFAFFSGNSSDLNEVLAVGGKLQGYTVTQITGDSVALQSPDQKETATVKIGDGLRQEGDKWLLSKENELSMSESASSSSSSSSSSTGSSSSTASAPPSSAESNDVLKRLMQLREKENQ